MTVLDDIRFPYQMAFEFNKVEHVVIAGFLFSGLDLVLLLLLILITSGAITSGASCPWTPG